MDKRARSVWLALLAMLLLAPTTRATSYSYEQALDAQASGEGAPVRGFGTQVAVDGDVAVVSDLASTLGIRRAIVRTYVRTAGVWTLDPQELNFDTGSPSHKVRLAMGGGTLAVMYLQPSGTNTTVRMYRRVGSAWQSDSTIGTSSEYESIAADGDIVVLGNPNGVAGFIQIRTRDSNGDWSGETFAAEAPQTGSRFGQSVAILAGAVVVGAPNEDVTQSATTHADAGAAYVFESNQNVWTQVARLVEPSADFGAGNGFGTAVAISGTNPAIPDRLLVSAFRNRVSQGGRVRSYTRTSNVWTPRQVFSATDPHTDDSFGCSLSLDGNWAVAGACTSHDTANFAGKVTVLRFANNFQSLISATDRFDALGNTNDAMGSSVSIDRDGPTLFVGAPGAEVYGNSSEGVVMIGRGGDSGDPVPRAIRRLDLGQGLTNAHVGHAVTDDDTLVLGAGSEDVGQQAARGAAYTFQRNVSGDYVFQSRLLAPDGVANDDFGSVLALRGDSLLVGAPNRSVQGIHEAGMTYAFRRVAGQWNLETQLIAPTPMASGGIGAGLAFDGTTAVICGRLDASSHVFERDAAGTWMHTQTIAHRCYTPQLAGNTLVLNDLFADLSGDSVGKVSTYTRSGGMWQFQSMLTGSNSSQQFGATIALDGDLLAVGSNGSANLPMQVFRRSGNNWLPEFSALPNDVTAGVFCSTAGVHAGRVAIGCSNQPGPQGPGAVYLFEKSSGIWTQTQRIVHGSPRDNDGFGSYISFHADGDLFISAPVRAVSFFGQGRVYRYAEPSPLLYSNGFE